MRRVVVTGLGVVSPFGAGLDLFWTELTRGTSAVRRIGRFDATPFPSQIAAEISGFDAEAYLPRRDIVRTDTFIHFALTAASRRFGMRSSIHRPATRESAYRSGQAWAACR